MLWVYIYFFRSYTTKAEGAVHAESDGKVYSLCPCCGEGYLDGLFMVPIEDLAADKGAGHGDNFREAADVKEGKKPDFGPGGVNQKVMLILGFKRKGSVVNKAEFYADIKTNPHTSKHTVHQKKTTASCEDPDKVDESETVYIFQHTPAMAHRRTCSMKWAWVDK